MAITQILAIYAAILSTSIFIWNVHQSRALIDVDLAATWEIFEDEGCEYVRVALRNPTDHKVLIREIYLMYRINAIRRWHIIRFALMTRSFATDFGWGTIELPREKVGLSLPFELRPRSGYKFFVPTSLISKILDDNERVILRAVVKDGLWKKRQSPLLKNLAPPNQTRIRTIPVKTL